MKIKGEREDIEMICIISHFVVALFSYFEVKSKKQSCSEISDVSLPYCGLIFLLKETLISL